jgi:hypothetical protein
MSNNRLRRFLPSANPQKFALATALLLPLMTFQSITPTLAQVAPTADNICTTEKNCDRRRPYFYWAPPPNCAPAAGALLPYLAVSGFISNSSSIPPIPNQYTLVNQSINRSLQMTGTPYKDAIVGAPDRTDALSGQGGGDTYVVGNQSRGLTGPLGIGDTFSIEPVPPTGEADRVFLNSGATLLPDYIYLNTPLEQAGGLVAIAPLPQVGGTWSASPYPGTITVAGSNSLLGPPIFPIPYRTSNLECRSGSFVSALSQPARIFELARLANHGQTRSIFPLAMVARPLLLDLSAGLLRLSAWLSQLTPIQTRSIQTTPSNRLAQTPIPGVPQISGFVATGERYDLLILPEKSYTNPLLNSNSENLISVVSGFNILQTKQALPPSAQTRRQTLPPQGNNRLNTSQYALFYFRESGLLVFSYNKEPLGSNKNHGKIIAQLQDRDGRPLVLPTKTLGTDTVAQAPFLAFQADDTPPRDARLTPSKPGTNCKTANCKLHGS